MVRPLTVIGDEDPVWFPVVPRGAVHVTAYDVIALPPFDDGTLKATDTWPFPRVAEVIDGAVGALTKVNALESADAEPVPTAFTAETAQR